MFILFILIILLLPVALLPTALTNWFSPDELIEMGIYLEDPGSTQTAPVKQVNGSSGSIRPCAGVSI